MKLKSFLLAALAAAGVPAFAADIIKSGQISSSETWTANNRYQLQGKVFIVNGATLTIDAGTVVQGRVSSGSDAAALVVTRGAKINALGTASNPIIFTSELDQLNGNLTVRDVGLWGGVVILGNAVLNSNKAGSVTVPITETVEGILITGGDAELTRFGGTNDDDNSGTFRYVSIRHGGAIVGTANELNGLTLAGVGRGTTIENIEVFANRDDGIEFFGGTVNAKYLIAAFCGDDAIDWDQGYRGTLQFVFVIQGDNRQNDSDDGYLSDKAFELDGAIAPILTATPIGGGTVFNGTFIGIGASLRPNGAAGNANTAIDFGGNGSHKIFNSVFVDYANMFVVAADQQARIDAGDFRFENNTYFSHIAANNTVNTTGSTGVFGSSTGLRPAFLTTGGNANVNPTLRSISRAPNRTLDPRPAAGSLVLNAAVTAPIGTYATATTYHGAFSDSNWAAGWTKLWTEGWFSLASAGTGETIPLPGSPNKFVNVSTRGFAGIADQTLTAGFAIPPGPTQTVMIRGVGPTLVNFGVSGTLADPVIEVYAQNATTPLATNDDWTGTQTPALAVKVGAFALAAGSKDSVLVLNLEAGSYTVQVKGKAGATGIAIVEVWEID